MNLFRLLGDLSHLASIFILIHKILTSRSCRGISFKTQLMYTIVFVTRYLDLLHPPSAYLILMKLFFISSSAYILYLMKVQFRSRYESDIDSIRLEYLLGVPAILALLFHVQFTFLEVMWSYSIFLEAVAILPQMFLLQRLGEAETITTHYIFALGAYRAMYLLNWIYRFIFERHHPFLLIPFLAGLVQTGLYGDFFYIYFTKVIQGKKFELPA
ncbi:endoplasmic reticulum retention protein [Malassezia arunalokei]|uniref:Endoplasmic reticulum retention protein n=1 Tax=Malassezia arunalokei TaxID=1514897 RepID=A0AAJ5Z571_9BASI|nr:endoplasmic reticulum retention protein [Malassezia arunalokei]